MTDPKTLPLYNKPKEGKVNWRNVLSVQPSWVNRLPSPPSWEAPGLASPGEPWPPPARPPRPQCGGSSALFAASRRPPPRTAALLLALAPESWVGENVDGGRARKCVLVSHSLQRMCMFLRGGGFQRQHLTPARVAFPQSAEKLSTIQLTIPRHTSGSWAYHRGFLGKKSYVGAGLGWG